TLTQTSQLPHYPLARHNAMEALADLYFYALRPGGVYSQQVSRFTLFSPSHQQKLQTRLLEHFEQLIRPKEGSPDPVLAREMQEPLARHWREWLAVQTCQNRSNLPDADLPALKRQVLPLINQPLPLPAPPAMADSQAANRLKAALVDPNPAALRQLSQ